MVSSVQNSDLFRSQKDRAEKRKGWSNPNAFHVCITSYKTATTIRAFKMKSWQYLILDDAQNIKNCKSQRWQALLNVKARRRLLTGTPLQNYGGYFALQSARRMLQRLQVPESCMSVIIVFLIRFFTLIVLSYLFLMHLFFICVV